MTVGVYPMMIGPRSIGQSSLGFYIGGSFLLAVDDVEDVVHSLLVEVQRFEDQRIDCMIFTLAHY